MEGEAAAQADAEARANAGRTEQSKRVVVIWDWLLDGFRQVNLAGLGDSTAENHISPAGPSAYLERGFTLSSS